MTPENIEPSTTLSDLQDAFRVCGAPGEEDNATLGRLVDVMTASSDELPPPVEYGFLRHEQSLRPGASELSVQTGISRSRWPCA